MAPILRRKMVAAQDDVEAAMIIGTAGHIDHGKTLLVKALTGVDTDRLPEEKRRGITIDLGFAYHRVGDLALGFVDVPGHERFVHTMVAGVCGIDHALLVVAADDGVMPQTIEHLQVLDLLGVPSGIVAITKADLVDEARLVQVSDEIRALIAPTSLARAALLPVAAPTGAGIDTLRGLLVAEAGRLDARRTAAGAGRAFRFAIDRRFSLAGAGTVVTGSVISGTIAIGDEVTVLPQGFKARVRLIHRQNERSDRGQAGDRCGLALAGRDIEREALHRGNWLVAPTHADMTCRFDAALTVVGTHRRPLSTWTPAMLHAGASAVGARIVVLSADPIAPGKSGLAQLVLEQPLPLRHGDRFIIRDPAAQRTIGGGRVLDPRAPERHRRSPERLARLDALCAAEGSTVLDQLLGLPPGFVDMSAFAADHMLTETTAETIIAHRRLLTLAAGTTRQVITPAGWAELVDDIKGRLAAFHRRNPDLPGMGTEALRRALPHRLERALFESVLLTLSRLRVVAVAPPWVRLASHVVVLSAEDEKLWRVLQPLIAAERYRPPKLHLLANTLNVAEPVLRRACKRLSRAGQLIEMALDRFFLRDAAAEMAQAASDLARADPAGFTAAAFRDRIPCGRNTAIEILEYFDRSGLTLRRGEVRKVVKNPAQWLGHSAASG